MKLPLSLSLSRLLSLSYSVLISLCHRVTNEGITRQSTTQTQTQTQTQSKGQRPNVNQVQLRRMNKEGKGKRLNRTNKGRERETVSGRERKQVLVTCKWANKMEMNIIKLPPPSRLSVLTLRQDCRIVGDCGAREAAG